MTPKDDIRPTMNLTPSDKKIVEKTFQEWKDDLEARLIEHLKQYPEREIKKISQSEVPTSKSDNLVVQVFESTSFLGRWCVWVNNALDKVFDGPTARLNATRYANGILNPADVAVGNPCVYCGRRSGHRDGCPATANGFI